MASGFDHFSARKIYGLDFWSGTDCLDLIELHQAHRNQRLRERWESILASGDEDRDLPQAATPPRA